MLVSAYLLSGGINDKNRDLYDLLALKYIIKGLKLKRDNSQLRDSLLHPGIKNTLEKYVINTKYTTIDDGLVDSIIKIGSDIDELEVS